MIAELLTMVTREDDQRVIVLPGRLEMPDDSAKVVVVRTDQTIVGRSHEAHLFLRHGARQPLSVTEDLRLFHGLHVVRQERMLLALDVWGCGPHWGGHLGRIVVGVIGRHSNKRRMWPIV